MFGPALQSCKVKDDLVNQVFKAFITKTADFDVTFPPLNANVNYNTLGTQTVHYDLDSAIRSETGNVFNINSVDKAYAEEMTLTLNGTTANVDAPDNDNNFANLESIRITFYSATNSTPVSFELTNNPDVYATTLSIPVDKNMNLKSYLTGTELYYTIEGKLRRSTTHSLKCNVVIKFKIDN